MWTCQIQFNFAVPLWDKCMRKPVSQFHLGDWCLDLWAFFCSFMLLYVCMEALLMSMHVGLRFLCSCESGKHGCIRADALNNMASVVSFQLDVQHTFCFERISVMCFICVHSRINLISSNIVYSEDSKLFYNACTVSLQHVWYSWLQNS